MSVRGTPCQTLPIPGSSNGLEVRYQREEKEMEHWSAGKMRRSPVGDEDEGQEGKMGGIATTTAKKRKTGEANSRRKQHITQGMGK